MKKVLHIAIDARKVLTETLCPEIGFVNGVTGACLDTVEAEDQPAPAPPLKVVVHLDGYKSLWRYSLDI